jgi:uncharacterized protein YodC (DUF2158 family)
MPFKIGDVVTLKSGGGKMTVEGTAEDSISCVWSDGKKVFRDKFHPDMLTEGPATLEELILAAGQRKNEPDSN